MMRLAYYIICSILLYLFISSGISVSVSLGIGCLMYLIHSNRRKIKEHVEHADIFDTIMKGFKRLD